MLLGCILAEDILVDFSDAALALLGVKGGKSRSLRGPDSKRDVKGVIGVVGAEMYLPLHFGQRTGSPVGDVERGRTPC